MSIVQHNLTPEISQSSNGKGALQSSTTTKQQLQQQNNIQQCILVSN